MQKCNNCGTEYDGDACPECGGNEAQSGNTQSFQELLNSLHPNKYVRTTIKVLLIALFLGLIALVVFFTDAAIEWIKGLF